MCSAVSSPKHLHLYIFSCNSVQTSWLQYLLHRLLSGGKIVHINACQFHLLCILLYCCCTLLRYLNLSGRLLSFVALWALSSPSGQEVQYMQHTCLWYSYVVAKPVFSVPSNTSQNQYLFREAFIPKILSIRTVPWAEPIWFVQSQSRQSVICIVSMINARLQMYRHMRNVRLVLYSTWKRAPSKWMRADHGEFTLRHIIIQKLQPPNCFTWVARMDHIARYPMPGSHLNPHLRLDACSYCLQSLMQGLRPCET